MRRDGGLYSSTRRFQGRLSLLALATCRLILSWFCLSTCLSWLFWCACLSWIGWCVCLNWLSWCACLSWLCCCACNWLGSLCYYLGCSCLRSTWCGSWTRSESYGHNRCWDCFNVDSNLALSIYTYESNCLYILKVNSTIKAH